jgi:hypothetical protein
MPNDELDELVASVELEAGELEIDLSEAKDFEVIDGTRPVEITEVKRATSKQSKLPMLELKLVVIGDDDAGRVVFKTLMLKGPGAGITKRYLTAFQADIDWDAPKISPQALVGLKANAVLTADTREEYKHKTVVKDIREYEDSATVDADELA